MLYRVVHLAMSGFELTTLVVIGTDCIVYPTTIWSQRPPLDFVKTECLTVYITILEYNVVYHPDSEPTHYGAYYLMQLSYGVIIIFK
jgi:hypothetical protein